MFVAEAQVPYAKARLIHDTRTDITLMLDTDDVNPDDVCEANVQRIVDGLNAAFYPDLGGI